MGTSASKLITRIAAENPKDFETMSCNVVDFCIPEDLLLVILSFVPASDLIKNCRLVCQQWKELIDAHAMWKIKCDRDRKVIPPCRFEEELPSNYYRLIYLHNAYGRNLLKNPCGTEDLMHWEIVHNGGDGIAVENPPGGADPVPKEVGTQFCFSTSYQVCAKHQLISLFSEGVSVEVLDSGMTKICLSEWYAARFDCGCIYDLKVTLLDDKYQPLDEFAFNHREEQWTGRAWSQVTHTFEDVRNVRHIIFKHSGQDTQFWAGNYGSKMTGASVRLVFN